MDYLFPVTQAALDSGLALDFSLTGGGGGITYSRRNSTRVNGINFFTKVSKKDVNNGIRI